MLRQNRGDSTSYHSLIIEENRRAERFLNSQSWRFRVFIRATPTRSTSVQSNGSTWVQRSVAHRRIIVPRKICAWISALHVARSFGLRAQFGNPNTFNTYTWHIYICRVWCWYICRLIWSLLLIISFVDLIFMLRLVSFIVYEIVLYSIKESTSQFMFQKFCHCECYHNFLLLIQVTVLWNVCQTPYDLETTTKLQNFFLVLSHHDFMTL